MPAAFIEVATVPEKTVLYLYGGRAGELPYLLMSTGARNGGISRIFRHEDRHGDSHWIDEGIPTDAETMCKIRDDGTRVYAFYETGGPFIISRLIPIGSPWDFEALPGPDFVGGHGIEAKPDGTVYAGGGAEWNIGTRRGELWSGSHAGGYGVIRTHEPGILWECFVDALDRLWEFWHDVPFGAGNQHTYLAGVEIDSPGSGPDAAVDFNGITYAARRAEELNPQVLQYDEGSDTWTAVHTFAGTDEIDNLAVVPRNGGELWATSRPPFKVAYTLDGTTWVDAGLPAINTVPQSTDGNHVTAVGYYCGRVYVAVSDDDAGLIRVYRENIPSRCAGSMLMVI